MARLVRCWIVPLSHFKCDDIVIFESLNLVDVSDIYTSSEAKLLISHSSQILNVCAPQTAIIRVSNLGIFGNESDRGIAFSVS